MRSSGGGIGGAVWQALWWVQERAYTHEPEYQFNINLKHIENHLLGDAQQQRRQRTTKTATEEYEDDETEDGPVDYPMDGGDDDDGDSSGDDADDEDEDDEDEDEEEEHLAPTDFAVVVPADEPVSPPEGTEPVIPQPSTDLTIGARIIVRH
ncbi:hypothetical protein Tco_1472146 [Tanacetum coccineum]